MWCHCPPVTHTHSEWWILSPSSPFSLQLGPFADLQFDPKGNEESICAKNENESDYN